MPPKHDRKFGEGGNEKAKDETAIAAHAAEARKAAAAANLEVEYRAIIA
jgi:hypothetical protein